MIQFTVLNQNVLLHSGQSSNLLNFILEETICNLFADWKKICAFFPGLILKTSDFTSSFITFLSLVYSILLNEHHSHDRLH